MAAKLTTEKWVEKAIVRHGSTYGYSKVVYSTSRTKVIIGCKEHGDFELAADKHLQGRGCQVCAEQAAYAKRRGTTEQFIADALKVHGAKFDYSKVKYTNANSKVAVVCPTHGEFEQRPADHVRGRGCNKCSNTANSGLSPTIGWRYDDWEKAGNASKHFKSFSVYIIKCWDGGEEFIKVGKTFVDVTKRFCSKNAMPYKYKVVTQVHGDAREISELEHSIQRLLKEHEYVPKIVFKGRTECFNISSLDTAVSKAES